MTTYVECRMCHGDAHVPCCYVGNEVHNSIYGIHDEWEVCHKCYKENEETLPHVNWQSFLEDELLLKENKDEAKRLF